MVMAQRPQRKRLRYQQPEVQSPNVRRFLDEAKSLLPLFDRISQNIRKDFSNTDVISDMYLLEVQLREKHNTLSGQPFYKALPSLLPKETHGRQPREHTIDYVNELPAPEADPSETKVKAEHKALPLLPSPDDIAYADQLLLRRLAMCSHELTREEWRVVFLHRFRGMTQKQIAQFLGEYRSTITSRWQSALKKMRNYFIKLDDNRIECLERLFSDKNTEED
jgi:hypothetical protein